MQRDFYLKVLQEVQPAGDCFNYLCTMSSSFWNAWNYSGPHKQSIKTDARRFLQLTNDTIYFVGAGLLFSTIKTYKKRDSIPEPKPIRIAFIEWASNPENEKYLDKHGKK